MLSLDRGIGGSVWDDETLVRDWSLARKQAFAPPVWRQILDAVSKEHRISIRDILEDGRFRQIVTARHDAMWRMRRAGMTYAAIGRRLNRDHATVMWGIKQHERRMALAGAR